MKFTAKDVASLKLPEGKSDAIYWDDDIAGFGLRIRAGGSRVWIYRYRIGRRQRGLVLGSATAVPLALARKNAGELEAKVRLGIDPAGEKQAARIEAETTFHILAEQYLEQRKSDWRPKTFDDLSRCLRKYAEPLHRFSLAGITQRQIANLLSSIAKESGETMANRVRATLSMLYAWALREGIKLPEGNLASFTHKFKEHSRERVLSDAEIAAVWNAAGDDDYGTIVRLLLLTGQRMREIGALRWDEIGDDEIVLPASRTKNHRAHHVPLGDAVKAILASRPRNGSHVFGHHGFTNWSTAKLKLDARITSKLAPWRIHDLRRTCATGLQRLGVRLEVTEAILNHVSGSRSGVAGVYQRHDWAAEKRTALNMWAEHLLAVVEARAATVVPLKRA
jgi:integrase